MATEHETFDAVKVIADIIHVSLNPKGNDYQSEARAVISALQEDSVRGDELRYVIFGHALAPAWWSHLDKTALASAQNIKWYAPHTIDVIIAKYANDQSKTATNPREAELWMQISKEIYP